MDREELIVVLKGFQMKYNISNEDMIAVIDAITNTLREHVFEKEKGE